MDEVETSPILYVAFLLILLFGSLTHVKAEATFPAGSEFHYDSTAGATGTIRTIANYTFSTPSSLTPTVAFFNMTGMTANVTAFPSSQFRFYAWNTSATGIMPITIQTGTVKPTYILNVTNYSYVNPNVTVSTLLSNNTVTVDFNLLGGYPIFIYSCSGTLASTPTYVSNTLTIVVTDSGAGAATTTLVSGMGEAPYLITQDGTPPALSGAVVWTSATDILTITGLGTWVLGFHQSIAGGSGLIPTSIGTLELESPLAVNQGENKNETLTVIVRTQQSFVISKLSFNQSWITSSYTQHSYAPLLFGLPTVVTIPVQLDGRNVNVGHYPVQVQIEWGAENQSKLTETKLFYVDVVEPFGGIRPPTAPASADQDAALLVVGIACVAGVLLYVNKRRRNRNL